MSIVEPPCDARDQELQATGGATCPPDSRLGPGQIWFESGLGSPFDPFWTDTEWYYGPRGLRVLFVPGG